MTATGVDQATTTIGRRRQHMPGPKRRLRAGRVVLYTFLIGTAVVWVFPIAWAVYTSLRPYAETARLGYVSLAQDLTFEDYVNAWEQGSLLMRFGNTMIIVLPAIVAVLFFASLIAYVVSRFSFRFNIALLLLFTAGNLLPPQVIITPLFRMYLELPMPYPLSDNGLWYDQYLGIIAIHVAFQLGFATFVLSNFMRTLPKELTEAALVDGASIMRTYRQVILPLCRPPLAALATLLFTWTYNDFYWALVLMRTGDKRPITTGLNDMQGMFFSDNNLLAAGAIMIALPTLLVYFVLQRQFVRGLTLGSTTG